jgi:S-adenosylmethionine synthetase
LAKNIVAAGLAEEVLVQVAYAIGVAEPMNLFIDTYGTSKVGMSDGEMAKKIYDSKIFDMRPKAIETRLKLRNPIYEESAAYGHLGREPKIVTKQFKDRAGNVFSKQVELFTWEKTDYVDQLKELFGK